MRVTIYDDRPCKLGEGALWHPQRGQLFWFDIEGRRLMTREDGTAREWRFETRVSAAGWIDRDTLMVAGQGALMHFDLRSGRAEPLAALEADNPVTRSNDGRADPWGGFWIGTMGRNAEPGAGAIWRYFRGELRLLHAPLTIPNAICFAPDGSHAYFCDTPRRQVMRQRLDGRAGWPAAEPELHLDLRAEGLNPDGAVVDAEGNLWLAEWGASRVACHAPDGRFLRAVTFPAAHTSCPALGGEGLTTLFCTSARQGLAAADIALSPENGMTFAAAEVAKGQAEHRVEP
ncbi:SMP-30/gluconolactonase/LRE family protein [Albidovulum sp.]